MRLVPLIAIPWIAAVVFWVVFGACIAGVPDEPEPAARLVTSWDPLACEDPHRVVVELEDEGGAGISASAPCWIGGLTLDVPMWGIYRGRVYAWRLGQAIRSVVPVEVTVDAPIVRWHLTMPP